MGSVSFLCPKEVARTLGVSERTAARLMASGEIASFRVGKLWRCQLADVERYVERQYRRYRRPAKAA
jgi:excisionase family DNA binding protein